MPAFHRTPGPLPSPGFNRIIGRPEGRHRSYSSIFGIPVALLGMGYSGTVLVAILAWWRGGRREGILAAYGLGLVGTLVEAYLVYLELFVIHAICLWCAAYDTTILLGSLLAVRRAA